MLAVNHLPISFVSNEGFIKFMEVVEPGYHIPSTGNIHNRLNMAYGEVRKKLLTENKKLNIN